MRKKIFVFWVTAATLCSIVLSGCGSETLSGNISASSTPAASVDLSANDILVSDQPVYEYETKEMYASRDGNQIYGVAYIPKDADFAKMLPMELTLKSYHLKAGWSR